MKKRAYAKIYVASWNKSVKTTSKKKKKRRHSSENAASPPHTLILYLIYKYAIPSVINYG